MRCLEDMGSVIFSHFSERAFPLIRKARLIRYISRQCYRLRLLQLELPAGCDSPAEPDFVRDLHNKLDMLERAVCIAIDGCSEQVLRDLSGVGSIKSRGA